MLHQIFNIALSCSLEQNILQVDVGVKYLVVSLQMKTFVNCQVFLKCILK